MVEESKIIKREEISITKSDNHYFLEISNNYYDIYRSFDNLDDLIKHLKKYPIENKEKVITEIKLRNRAEEMEKRGLTSN